MLVTFDLFSALIDSRTGGSSVLGRLAADRGWQVGQYCRDESANETSRTVSPQTGQGIPVRPWTARFDFFSPLSSEAASPEERATASPSTCRIAV